MRTRIAIVSLSALVAACGDTGQTPPTTTPDTSEVTSAQSPAPEATKATTTTIGDTDALDGERFVDPEGDYEIIVGVDWVANHGVIGEGIEVWALDATNQSFVANVNILTQVTPPEMGTREYYDLSLDGAATVLPDFELVESEFVTTSDGQELAVVAYTGAPDGQPLSFFAVWIAGDGEAIVATLSTTPDDYEAFRTDVEPHLLTIRQLP